MFLKNWYMVGYIFWKIGIKSGINFGKIAVRNGYVFEASMARPRPKSRQVGLPPPGIEMYVLGFIVMIKSMLVVKRLFTLDYLIVK